MGQSQKHALGRNQRFYAVPETTFGTFVKPTGANALKVLTSTVEFGQERVERNDARQTRSWLERITRRKTVGWSLEKFLLPSGTADVPPDDGPLLKAALGVETINGGTSVVYSLAAAQAALGSLTLVRELNGVLMEAIVGAWVEAMTISISGGEEPKISFEGGAADHIGTGATGIVNGAQAALDTAIELNPGKAAAYDVGSVVAFVDAAGAVVDDNAGAGFEVTNVDDAGDILTISPGLVNPLAGGERTIPFVPTEVTAGSAIAGIVGDLQLDSVSLPVTAAEVSVTNNNKALNDEAFQDKVTDYFPQNRDVVGSLTVRARRDEIAELGERKKFTVRDLDIVFGSGAGTTWSLDLPTIEMDFSAVEVPESEEASFSLPFRSLGASGEDEFTLTQT